MKLLSNKPNNFYSVRNLSMKETLAQIGLTDKYIRNLFLMSEIGKINYGGLFDGRNCLIFLSSILERAVKTKFMTLRSEDFSESRMRQFVKRNPLHLAKTPNSTKVEKMSTDSFYDHLLSLSLLNLISKGTVNYAQFTYMSNPITGKFSEAQTHWDMNVSREALLQKTIKLQTIIFAMLANNDYEKKEPQNVLSLGHFVANILENNQ